MSLNAHERQVGERAARRRSSKRMKVVDVLQKWDASSDSELDKGEFRQNVKGLGVQADSNEIDELFDELNTSGGTQLSMVDIKNALKTLTDAAMETDKNIKELKRSQVDLAKSRRPAGLQEGAKGRGRHRAAEQEAADAERRRRPAAAEAGDPRCGPRREEGAEGGREGGLRGERRRQAQRQP